MGLNCGIIGLPNVGKSTIFSALTSTQVDAANYPFCTIEPNVGIVQVPDSRLKKISEFVKPDKILPAFVEFVDIAGLVKGASKGEGLGNQFLGHIRNVGAIAHVVRCFDHTDIIHVHGKVDPIDDIETVNLELIYSDLETIEKKIKNLEKNFKSQDLELVSKSKNAKLVLEEVKKILECGRLAISANLSKEEFELINDLHLITLKPQVYVCNVDEESIVEGNDYVKKVAEYAEKNNSQHIILSGQIEKEISLLETEEEKQDFMEAIGIEESGLNRLIRKGYELLGLQTYFTAGKQEVRAWTIQKGWKAPRAASVIHTDFEKGFIRVEVYSCQDLFELGSEQKVKDKGRFRVEGKEYLVADGDILHFRFNV
jgi:GTP-binding protein YchF